MMVVVDRRLMTKTKAKASTETATATATDELLVKRKGFNYVRRRRLCQSKTVSTISIIFCFVYLGLFVLLVCRHRNNNNDAQDLNMSHHELTQWIHQYKYLYSHNIDYLNPYSNKAKTKTTTDNKMIDHNQNQNHTIITSSSSSSSSQNMMNRDHNNNNTATTTTFNNINNKNKNDKTSSKPAMMISQSQSQSQSLSQPYPPIGKCAINLFGLPRSFKYYVLPSLIKNVIEINNKYQCDYFVHFFNVTTEQTTTTTATSNNSNNNSTNINNHNTNGRGGNDGGIISPDDVFLLRDAVLQSNSRSTNTKTDESSSSSSSSASEITHEQKQVVEFVSDTDGDFERKRRMYIDEIVLGVGGLNNSTSSDNNNNNNSNNPYLVREKSFTDRTLLNILKMWHSQDEVWNLMESFTNKNGNRSQKENNNYQVKNYHRVSMMRLDVIYTTPIDIYRVPYDPIPYDYNEEYLQGLRKIRKNQKQKNKGNVQYFYDYEGYNDNNNVESSNVNSNGNNNGNKKNIRNTNRNSHCVLPGFKSFPVNDRYFTGPYNAVKIWAKDRFSRARRHVTEILPTLQREKEDRDGLRKNNDTVVDVVHYDETIRMRMTDYGLHDEKFVAYTILPAIRELQTNGGTNNNNNNNIIIHVDRELYFVRVRADGSIWLRDKPGFGRVKKNVLESVLGRKCTGYEPYEVYDEILGEKSPGKWQMKCPPPITIRRT